MKNEKNLKGSKAMHRLTALRDPYFGSVRDERTTWAFSRSRFWSNLGNTLFLYWVLMATLVSATFSLERTTMSLNDFLVMLAVHHVFIFLFAIIAAHVEVSK